MKRTFCRYWSRREFMKGSLLGLASLPPLNISAFGRPRPALKTAKVALIKTDDRKTGVNEVLSLFDFATPKGKTVFIKPNFNTSDPTPGSTHNDTLSQLVRAMHDQGAAKISVGDRSGPEETAQVLHKKRIPEMGKELDFEVVNFSELAEDQWVLKKPEGSHWDNGFRFSGPVLQAEYIVSTCCLKTHGFGGVFTMSLKNSVGLLPKPGFMRELHGKRTTHMRRMIAEINTAYQPRLIVLDGIEAFVDKGPMEGPRKTANVFLAGDDRVAVDAVGLAILKDLGSNETIMQTKIFAQEQVARAAELGLGVSSAEQIEIVTADRAGRAYADRLKTILAAG